VSDTEATIHVVYFDLDVKSWTSALPGVREARPARCPCCLTPSVLPDERIVLHGHGVRERQHWGPSEPEAPAEVGSLLERRYRCTQCQAVVTVRPGGVLPHRRYTAAAIALSLWMWAIELGSDRAVRDKMNPRPTTGTSRPERWTTLRRWAKAARDGKLWSRVRAEASWTLRRCAERVAWALAGWGDVEVGCDRQRVFLGAARVR
jgi:hypothetical protein